MISTLTFGMGSTPFGSPSGILVSRSTDGGLTWQNPVETFVGGFLDKNWITCDTWPQSPHYGNCYQEWDDFGAGGQIFMNTSTDGGLTWSQPVQPGGLPTGLGGQPVVQPNGHVVVPYTTGNEIRVFRTEDGGSNWTSSTSIDHVTDHAVAGNLRTSALPSAEVDAAGTVYVVWQDCRFRTGCASNDIVMSTGTNGFTWTAARPDPDRRPEQRGRPLHPGHRRRPLDLGRKRPARPRVLLLPGRRLQRVELRPDRRLHLVDRRRLDLDAAAQGRRPLQDGLDRPDRPGADGRGLHLDLVRGRAARLPGVHDREAADGLRRSTSGPHPHGST